MSPEENTPPHAPAGFPERRLKSIDNRIAYRERQLAVWQTRLKEKQLSRAAVRWARAHTREIEREILTLKEEARLLMESRRDPR
jgi:cob(I)alamin adenosyltransferase